MNTDLQIVDVYELGDLQPILEGRAPAFEVRLHQLDAAPVLEALAEKAPGAVRALELSECWGFDGDPSVLGVLARFPRLRGLAMGWCDCGEVELAALCDLELPALQRFWLWDELSMGSVEMLARAPWWLGLASVTLQADVLSVEALEGLFGADMPALRHLELAVLDPAPILSGPQMGHLTSLVLEVVAVGGVDSMTSEGWRPRPAPDLIRLGLSASSRHLGRVLSMLDLPALKVLELGQSLPAGTPDTCRIGDEGAAHIARAWPGLEVAQLHDCGIGPEGARALGAGLVGPLELTVSFNPLGTAGLKALLPCLGRVRRLLVHHCQLDGDAIEALVPVLGQLKELHLRGNPIGEKGARILCETPMPKLDRLWLSGCQVGTAGFDALVASDNFEGLSFLEMPDKGRQSPSLLRKPWVPGAIKRFFGVE